MATSASGRAAHDRGGGGGRRPSSSPATTVTAEARRGNPPPRVTETPAGMSNAIGLENPGIDAWIDGLPEWAALHSPVIVSVGGNAPDQFADALADQAHGFDLGLALSRVLHAADFFGDGVAFSLECFHILDQASALLIERQHGVYRGAVHLPGRHALADHIRLLADQVEI